MILDHTHLPEEKKEKKKEEEGLKHSPADYRANADDGPSVY